MLKEKMFTPEISSIFGMRISTGEEIVGKMIAKSDTAYEIYSPLALVMTQTGPSLAPLVYTMGLSKKVVLNRSCIVAEFDIDTHTHKAFEQSTSSIVLK